MVQEMIYVLATFLKDLLTEEYRARRRWSKSKKVDFTAILAHESYR